MDLEIRVACPCRSHRHWLLDCSLTEPKTTYVEGWELQKFNKSKIQNFSPFKSNCWGEVMTVPCNTQELRSCHDLCCIGIQQTRNVVFICVRMESKVL
jgi:hypothetical protein